MERKNRIEELLNVLRRGVSESVQLVEEMQKDFKQCSSKIRMEQDEPVFNELSQNFTNLTYLIGFLEEVKKGVVYLDGFNVPEAPFSCWENSLSLFNEMYDSFQNRDWITLADLIEYELDPLLQTGKDGLIELKEQLCNYSV